MTTRAAATIATSAGSDDAIVAQVDGRPVWASCVAAQGSVIAAKLETRDEAAVRRQALDECVAFELLAQEAERRSLTDAPEVVDATRAALVNRLVETGFERRYARPEDLGDRLDTWLRDNEWRRHRPELRGSAYLRVTGDSATAQKTAQEIYARLAAETGLFAVNLKELAAQYAGAKVEFADVPEKASTELEPSYRATLFAIPEVGRVAPPTKTPWGWDVILWTSGLSPLETSREEMAQTAFPELRRSVFPIWVAEIERQLGIKPKIDPAQAARLDEVGP